MYVLHRCDNPACVQPTHLFLGDQYDNMADMVAKGRHRKPSDPRQHAKGRHKLTEAQVVGIKYRLRDGERHVDIAQDYGVSAATISNIKRGIAYGYVRLHLSETI